MSLSDNICNYRLDALQLRLIRASVNELIANPNPMRAIQNATARWNDPSASPFQRYAGMVLRKAGGEEFAKWSLRSPVQLIPPSDGHLARLVCASKLDKETRKSLGLIEDAVNRLICIADALEDSSVFSSSSATPISISFMGMAFRSDKPGYRSALVALPPIGMAEEAQAGYFNEVDWRTLDHIASTGRTVFQDSLKPNMNQSILGAWGPDGSDWDVRSRLARIIEGLELPLQARFWFDCNVEAQSAAVRFTAAPNGSFPSYRADKRLQGIADIGEELEDARIAYLLRLSCLVGAACFGSGKHIETAYVSAVDPDCGTLLIGMEFERDTFVRTVLSAIDSGELSNPEFRFDPKSLALLISPNGLYCPALSLNDDDSRFNEYRDAQRVPPHDDKRLLSTTAQEIFRAKRICDIDTTQYHGERGPEIDEARADSEESLISAIARLESVIDDFEIDPDDQNEMMAARPLYCDQPFSRATISLLDDQLSVALQAEEFLSEHDTGIQIEGRATVPSYFRAPSALYHAHYGLSDLYERMGDFAGAEAQADLCIALAPSTPSAYFRKADILAQQGRYEEAANIISAALRFTASERDCSMLYYHLALILWNLGRQRDAAAVFVYTAFLKGNYAEKAVEAIRNLRKRQDKPVILYASPIAAAREMSRAGIPVAPSDAARALVVKAAISLCNSNAPCAAAPYAVALAHYVRDDRVVKAACDSICNGVPPLSTSN